MEVAPVQIMNKSAEFSFGNISSSANRMNINSISKKWTTFVLTSSKFSTILMIAIS